MKDTRKTTLPFLQRRTNGYSVVDWSAFKDALIASHVHLYQFCESIPISITTVRRNCPPSIYSELLAVSSIDYPFSKEYPFLQITNNHGHRVADWRGFVDYFKSTSLSLFSFCAQIHINLATVRSSCPQELYTELLTISQQHQGLIQHPFLTPHCNGYKVNDWQAFEEALKASMLSLFSFCKSIGISYPAVQRTCPPEVWLRLKGVVDSRTPYPFLKSRGRNGFSVCDYQAFLEAFKKSSMSLKAFCKHIHITQWRVAKNCPPDIYNDMLAYSKVLLHPTLSKRAKHMHETHTGIASDVAYHNRYKSLGSSGSKPQNALAEELRTYGFNVLTENTKLLDGTPCAGQHIDIYLPDYKIGIEVNGEAFHYTPYHKGWCFGKGKGHNKDYHLNKMLCAQQNGIHLLHFWAHTEVEQRYDQVLNKVLSLTGMLKRERVYARKTIVRKVDATEVREFLNAYHIQGYVDSTYYALYSKDNVLLSCMGFKKHAKNTKDGKESVNAYNLTRYCTHPDYFVVGGYEKLEKAMVCDLKPDFITSIADRRTSTGALYEHQGFYKVAELAPDYMYFVHRTLYHKFNFRLKDFRDNPTLKFKEGLTEAQLAELNGIPRCYDCGKTKYRKDFKPQH